MSQSAYFLVQSKGDHFVFGNYDKEMKDHHVLGKYCSSPQIGSVEGEGPQTTLGADWTSGRRPLPTRAEHTQASQV